MRVIIEYKDQTKKLVRNNLQIITITEQHKNEECIWIQKHKGSYGTLLSLKNIVSLDILEG